MKTVFKKRRALTAVACLIALSAGPALADCPLTTTIKDVTSAYAKGESLEKAGKQREALFAYVHAQEETCDPNPVAARAAKRAAALAMPLAQAAQERGDHQAAFDLFEAGGYFAQADREFIAILRANPDDPSLFERARLHFNTRGQAWFAESNRHRLAVTGPYKVDPALLAEVKAAVTVGVDRALQRETTAFDEAYLSEHVRIAQATPDDPTDFTAAQRLNDRYKALFAKWPGDLMAEAIAAIDLVRRWSSVAVDPAQSEVIEARRAKRIEERVSILTQRYSGAPKLLGLAIDYAGRLPDSGAADARVRAVKAQAVKLGEAAEKAQRLPLAAEYYSVAEARDRQQAVSAKLQARMQAKLAPAMEKAKRDAEALQRDLSDPARIEEMRRQAEAAQRAIAQSRADAEKNREARKKRTDELEEDLGL